MGPMAFPITNPMIVYSAVYSGANQRKHQSSASLAFVRVIHRSSVNSSHKGPVTRKMFPFDDVIMGKPHSGQPARYVNLVNKICIGNVLLYTCVLFPSDPQTEYCWHAWFALIRNIDYTHAPHYTYCTVPYKQSLHIRDQTLQQR